MLPSALISRVAKICDEYMNDFYFCSKKCSPLFALDLGCLLKYIYTQMFCKIDVFKLVDRDSGQDKRVIRMVKQKIITLFLQLWFVFVRIWSHIYRLPTTQSPNLGSS